MNRLNKNACMLTNKHDLVLHFIFNRKYHLSPYASFREFVMAASVIYGQTGDETPVWLMIQLINLSSTGYTDTASFPSLSYSGHRVGVIITFNTKGTLDEKK